MNTSRRTKELFCPDIIFCASVKGIFFNRLHHYQYLIFLFVNCAVLCLQPCVCTRVKSIPKVRNGMTAVTSSARVTTLPLICTPAQTGALATKWYLFKPMRK